MGMVISSCAERNYLLTGMKSILKEHKNVEEELRNAFNLAAEIYPECNYAGIWSGDFKFQSFILRSTMAAF